tara:strand:- start:95 stop:670 length:576 start_codon:yes stop_codon:yes gene_type:complete
MPISKILTSSYATLDATKLSGNLPAISGASLTGIAGGLTVADQFRVNATFTNDALPITSNWERIDTSGQGVITGSQMSESSGIFTFPSTGIYLVRWIAGCRAYSGNSESQYEVQIQVTTNNSSYTSIAESHACGSGSNSDTSAVAETFVDVTDVANVKVRVGVMCQQSNTMTLAGSSKNDNSLTFTRMGDT